MVRVESKLKKEHEIRNKIKYESKMDKKNGGSKEESISKLREIYESGDLAKLIVADRVLIKESFIGDIMMVGLIIYLVLGMYNKISLGVQTYGILMLSVVELIILVTIRGSKKREEKKLREEIIELNMRYDNKLIENEVREVYIEDMRS